MLSWQQVSRMGSYYGWVPKPKNGQKGGERRLAWEGIGDNEYKTALKYFEKNAVNDVEKIYEAWARDKINDWVEYPVPGPSPVSYTHLTLPTICSV
eukprot:2008137-Rhodomonas_salina.1